VLTYGVVPPGFRQFYPPDGNPPTLSAGTPYVVFAGSPIYEGRIRVTLHAPGE
jgi:hypothetical protein